MNANGSGHYERVVGKNLKNVITRGLLFLFVAILFDDTLLKATDEEIKLQMIDVDLTFVTSNN